MYIGENSKATWTCSSHTLYNLQQLERHTSGMMSMSWAWLLLLPRAR